MKICVKILALFFLHIVLSCNIALAEEAVIVHFPLSSSQMGTKQELDQIFKLETLLETAIIRNKAGEFDGNEIGQGECVLFMYGPDAKLLYKAISGVLENSLLVKGGIVRIRFGPPGSKEEKVKL